MERNLIAREIDDLAGLRQYDVPGGPTIFNYRPRSGNTMVLNMKELSNFNTDIPILNWRSKWHDNPVPHNMGVLGTNPKNKIPRKKEGIFQLVIHETATPTRKENTSSGYAATADRHWSSSHLSVTRNGTVLNFNDLYQRLNHCQDYNAASIGIEFVNAGWIEKAPSNECKMIVSGLAEKYPKGNNYLYCFWNGQNVYRIPPERKQLEAMTNLIRFFIIDMPFAIKAYKEKTPNYTLAVENIANWFSVNPDQVDDAMVDTLCPIDRKWLQLISYNNIPEAWKLIKGGSENLPSETERDQPNLFVVNKAYNLFEKDIAIDSVTALERRGVFAHGAFVSRDDNGHPDGCFITLYAWLRIEKQYPPDKALHIAKVLMDRHFIRFNTFKRYPSAKDKYNTAIVVVLDVRDKTLRKALDENYPLTYPDEDLCKEKRKKEIAKKKK